MNIWSLSFACVLLSVFVPSIDAGDKGDRPLRILLPQVVAADPGVATRLRQLRFIVKATPWREISADSFKDVDVLYLATQWAEAEAFEHFEGLRDAIQSFVKNGGGLVVGQPNRNPDCVLRLLPFPIKFQNAYDGSQPERINLKPDHFITLKLPVEEMPFPADLILEIDERYTILAKQKSTGSPSLAVTGLGDGRIVIHTANESPKVGLSDRILRRMVLWAGGREN